MFRQGVLHIRSLNFDDKLPHPAPSPFIVLFKFQPHTISPRPSFDLSHLVEIGATIRPHNNHTPNDLVDGIFSIWEHDELISLNNFERLQIGVCLNGNDSFGRPQMRLDEYLEDLADTEWNSDSVFDILDRMERKSEPLRTCDRRYELEITVDGFPFHDVLRVWKEMMAAEEIEESVEDTDESAESTE